MSLPENSQLLSAYLDGELPANEREQVEQWLNTSAGSRRELHDLRLVSDWVRELPTQTLPPGFSEEVLHAAERAVLLQAPTPAATHTFWSRHRVISLASAAAALAVICGTWTMQAGPEREMAQGPPLQPASVEAAGPAKSSPNAAAHADPVTAVAVAESAAHVKNPSVASPDAVAVAAPASPEIASVAPAAPGEAGPLSISRAPARPRAMSQRTNDAAQPRWVIEQGRMLRDTRTGLVTGQSPVALVCVLTFATPDHEIAVQRIREVLVRHDIVRDELEAGAATGARSEATPVRPALLIAAPATGLVRAFNELEQHAATLAIRSTFHVELARLDARVQTFFQRDLPETGAANDAPRTQGDAAPASDLPANADAAGPRQASAPPHVRAAQRNVDSIPSGARHRLISLPEAALDHPVLAPPPAVSGQTPQPQADGTAVPEGTAQPVTIPVIVIFDVTPGER